jgi:hypothetical protein
MDYSKIMADPSVGTSIGRLYLSAPDKITPLVTECYRRFAEQVDDQYRWLLRDVRVTFTDDDPYADASELFRDIRRGSFAVYATQEDQRHPILTPGQNNRFRAGTSGHDQRDTGTVVGVHLGERRPGVPAAACGDPARVGIGDSGQVAGLIRYSMG